MRWLAFFTVLAIVFFLSFPRLDIALSAPFVSYPPGPEYHAFSVWQGEPVTRGIFVWVKRFSYLYAALLVFLGLYKLACGTTLIRWQSWRYLMVVLLAGPVLMVDLSIKPFFDRPRPRDIIEFHGTMDYVPPLHIGSQSGNSFVSGHAAAGFYVAAFAMLARTRRLRISLYVLSLALGSGIGFTRIMSGGHFASDVVFSCLIMLWTIHLSWWIIQRVVPPEQGAPHA